MSAAPEGLNPAPSRSWLELVPWGVYSASAVAGIVIGLIPGGWLVPRMTAFAAARSVDGVVSQAGIDQMLLAVRLAWVAALGVGVLGLMVTVALVLLARRSREPALKPPAEASGPDRVAPPWALATIAGLMTLAAAVWAQGLAKGLSYDEAYSALRFVDPSAPWAAFFRFETLNNHPLYSMLAALTSGLMGGEEWALRLPALFAAVIAIPMSFFVAARVSGWKAGLLTAFLVATSPILAEYSVQARGYSLLFLLSLGSVWFFDAFRAGERTGRGSAGWVLVSALGLWTHLFMGIVILGQVVAALVTDLKRGVPQRAVRTWAMGTLAVVVGCMGYLPVLHRLLFEIIAFTVLAESTLARSTSDAFWITGSPPGGVAGWVVLAAVLSLALVGLLGRSTARSRSEGVLSIGGPLAIGFLLFAGTDQGVRFFVPLAAMLTIAVALGAMRLGRAGALVGVALVLAAGVRAPEISRSEVAGLRDFTLALQGAVTNTDCLVLEWSVGDVIRYYRQGVNFSYDRDFTGGCEEGRVLYGCHFCDRPGPGLNAMALREPILSISDPTGRPYRLFAPTDDAGLR